MHQHHVDRQAMQPGGKGRIAAKGRDLAVQLKKSLLCQVFRFGNIADHAQTQGIDAPFVKRVEMSKRVVVSGLGPGQHLGVRRGWRQRR